MNKEQDLYYVLETKDASQAVDIALLEGDSYIDKNYNTKLIITRNENGTFLIDITKESFKDNRLTKPELKAIREYLSNFDRDGDVLPKITDNGVTLSLNREFDMSLNMETGDIDSISHEETYKTMAYAKMIGYSIINILREHVVVLNHRDKENKEAWFRAY